MDVYIDRYVDRSGYDCVGTHVLMFGLMTQILVLLEARTSVPHVFLGLIRIYIGPISDYTYISISGHYWFWGPCPFVICA